MLLFSVQLGWLPAGGIAPAGAPLSEHLRHMILPALALGIGRSAVLVRYVRGSMLEELGREYVVTAQAMGLTDRSIRYRHALKNALLPVITIAGIQFGYMLGGTIIIEQVFSLPGVGRLLLTAIYQRDFPVIQGSMIFVALIYMLVNLIVDISYAYLNPRIKYH